jgi:hypothetical protein
MRARNKKVSPQKAASTPAGAPEPSRFETDLLTRGEAMELTPDGKLPLEATHAIVKKPDGTRTIKRVRFKAF